MKFEIDTEHFVAQTIGGGEFWVMKYQDYRRLEYAIAAVLSMLAQPDLQRIITSQPRRVEIVNELHAAKERKD